MEIVRTFTPLPASTKNITVTGASQRVQIGAGVGFVGVRLVNDGDEKIWIEFGDEDVVAVAATGLPILPGVTEVLTARNGNGDGLYVAVIGTAGGGEFSATPGSGI